MTLSKIIDTLVELKFLNVHSKVQIVVTKGHSLNKNDKLFESFMPINEAKHFFGNLKVITNQVRILEDVSGFWFLLAYEEEEK